MTNTHARTCPLSGDPAFYTAAMECSCRPIPLAASHPDHPVLTADQLLEQVSLLTLDIERCGASPELTAAVTRAVELHHHLSRFVATRAAVDLPPLNPDLANILGRPNFTCNQLAQYLRAIGQTVPMRAEWEQAAVIHWLLGLYFKHGSSWSEMAHAEIKTFQLAQRGSLL